MTKLTAWAEELKLRYISGESSIFLQEKQSQATTQKPKSPNR